MAEFERNLIRERTRAGLAAARSRGRLGGRKPALDAKQIREIRALLRDPDVNVTDVAKRYGVSRTTNYKHAGTIQPTKDAHAVSGHDKWLREEVQAATDDPRPAIPHKEAMNRVRTNLAALSKKAKAT